MNITGFALNTPRLTIALIALIVLAGVSQFLTFPRQEDPPIVIREAVVTAFFPGMTPLQMEELVTRPIEAEIRTMPEIDEIWSDTKTGVAVIHVDTRDQYDDLSTIWQSLRNKMADMSPELPDGTIGPFVDDEFGLVAVATIGLRSDGFSMAEMRVVARDVRDSLYALEGIRKVELYGVQDEQVTLKFSNARLSQFGISPGDVVDNLVRQNVVLPGGNLDIAGQNIVLSPSGSFPDEEAIGQALLSIPGTQQMVRLSDLLEVERGYVDPPQALAYFNGEPTIVIAVSITPGVNSVDFGERLTARLDELESQLPVGYGLDYATFQPELVQAAVNGALSSVYQTLAIVLVVVMLFLGLRTGLIVGSFVPITMLLGVIVMGRFGIELERVSIISAIVALGMLVDNAIVVAEDIRSRLERGQERRLACVEAGQSLAVPLLTSSLTTILAFVPMLLVEGQTGEYVFSLPMVVIILLLSSWLLSMYMTPAMCFWFMKVNAHQSDGAGTGAQASGEQYGGGFYRQYRALLEAGLHGRGLVLLITIGMVAGAGYAATTLVKEFFGPSDRNQFLVYIDLPAGYRIEATDAVVRQLSGWLSDQSANPEVTSSIAYVGTGGPRFFLSLSPVDPDPHVAFLVVNTETGAQVPDLVGRTRAYIDRNFANVKHRVKRMWLGANEPGLVEFRLVGLDPDHLFAKGRDLQAALEELPGIAYVHNDWENKMLRLEILVDQIRGRRAGVTSREVAVSLNAFLDGVQVTDYREGDVAIPVVLQATDVEREVLGDLWNVNVYSQERGTNVPLTQIADIRGAWQFSRIAHKDQERTLTISTKHTTLKAPELLARMEPMLADLDLQRGHRWEIGGEIEDSAETNEKLFGPLPACVLGIVLLLVWQFNSFRRPLIIMLTIPMAFAGALVGLIVMRAPFDFFAILGLLSLAGVIINNGIVLIDRMDSARRELGDDYQGVVFASVSRFRPILMSAITTILGVMPLIVFPDPLFYAMACVIAFGLAVGTVLSLLVVPIMYSLFMGISPPGRRKAPATAAAKASATPTT